MIKGGENVQKSPKIFKTLIFQIWWIWNTLRIGCFIPKTFFLKSTFLMRLNIFTLQTANFKAQIGDLGVPSHWKVDKSRKCVIFFLTLFTFCPIAQLSDVLASKFEVLRHRESKSFLAHSRRARTNEYSGIYRPFRARRRRARNGHLLFVGPKFFWSCLRISKASWNFRLAPKSLV